VVKNVADARQKAGKRDEDALQFLLDQGDDMTNIISFIIGALFAGLLNSGIAGSWILCYLATHRDWLQQVREEVESVANRYCADTDMPLKERLMKLPIEAWETGFPIVDLCLKETIRLQLHGTMFRRNHSNQDITINRKTGEIIPAGNYAAFHVGDVHFNPDVFSNPDEWDPSRYTAAKAEDKKETYAFIGWGK
jgi:sterol 14-demethylase